MVLQWSCPPWKRIEVEEETMDRIINFVLSVQDRGAVVLGWASFLFILMFHLIMSFYVFVTLFIILPVYSWWSSFFLLPFLLQIGYNVLYFYHRCRCASIGNAYTVPKSGEWCFRCNAPKPISSHHCSACKQCVVSMDHHCPWMTQCIGAHNSRYFFLFLWNASFGCLCVLCLSLPLLNSMLNNDLDITPICSSFSILPILSETCEDEMQNKGMIQYFLFMVTVFSIGISIVLTCLYGSFIFFMCRGGTYIDYLKRDLPNVSFMYGFRVFFVRLFLRMNTPSLSLFLFKLFAPVHQPPFTEVIMHCHNAQTCTV